LAQVTEILGRQRISLSSIMQHEINDKQFVPIVITTHQAKEGSMQQALKELNALPAMSGPAICLRIIDPPRELPGLRIYVAPGVFPPMLSKNNR